MKEWINDDCFNVLPTLEDDSVDLVFTSPPDLYDIGTDDVNVYQDFLRKGMDQFARIVKDTGFITLCQSDRKIDARVYAKHAFILMYMESLGWILKDYKIIVKNSIDSMSQFIFPYQHMCVFTKLGTIERKGEWLKHILLYKTQKSKFTYYIWHEAFCKLVINTLTKENDLVVDPFGGSSQVVQCAKELNRQYLGCEIDKEGYEIAIIRTSLI
jgi:DNA modification methylase|tara:strand:+ start:2913 stop:3551 length:639 start_codon:yes stop_codon:yes gene_type:complete